MSKVEVIGPRDALLKALDIARTSEILQIDPDIQHRIESGAETTLKPLLLDGKALAERLFYEDLDLKVVRLLSLLPASTAKPAAVSAPNAMNALSSVTSERITLCELKTRRRDALRNEMNELNRYSVFLTTVQSLVPSQAEEKGLDVIAVQVQDQAALERLTRVAGKLLLGGEVRTARGDDGSYIGLLTPEKQLSEGLKNALKDEQIPEVALPAYMQGLSLNDKVHVAKERYEALEREGEAIDSELRGHADAWRGVYEQAHEWLQEQLALLKTTALTYGTDNCFVLFGWVPSQRLPQLRETLKQQFGDTVVVEEREILEHDLDTVPVSLKNPAYFKPFELLVGLLPLPRYTSIDPTPFLGIFFPLFFGMILGDVGYGVILLIGALALVFVAKQDLLRQGGRILGVSAVYTILFGVLYGEFFGDLGTRAFGLTPWIDRRTSLMPMFIFAVAVGSVHVVVGLILGVVAALKGKQTKEAGFRLASILFILCFAGVLFSSFAPVAQLFRRPLMIALAIIAPALLLTGGFLAPFELLKSLGNIISYVRIMAVGLASVLLAYVANQLAGAVGSIWVGILIAVILHAFNMILGVFAPSIHALRLHYVEFFGKFFEPGGKPFLPLRKAH